MSTGSALPSSVSHPSQMVRSTGFCIPVRIYAQSWINLLCAPSDLEWKLLFVSSPGSDEYDQELDDCMVGPVPVGVNSFEFSSPAPDPKRIPKDDVLGVAAIILTASYRDQEFVRVGYYQNTEYDNDEMKMEPPAEVVWERLVRELAEKPRVTRFTIKWYDLALVYMCTIPSDSCFNSQGHGRTKRRTHAYSNTAPSAHSRHRRATSHFGSCPASSRSLKGIHTLTMMSTRRMCTQQGSLLNNRDFIFVCLCGNDTTV